MKAYLHFSETRPDGTKDTFQTIGVPAKMDGTQMRVLWGVWRAVRDGHVTIEGKRVPVTITK